MFKFKTKPKPIGVIGMQVAFTMISVGKSSTEAFEIGKEFSDKFGTMTINDNNAAIILEEFEERISNGTL